MSLLLDITLKMLYTIKRVKEFSAGVEINDQPRIQIFISHTCADRGRGTSIFKMNHINIKRNKQSLSGAGGHSAF